MLEPFLLVLHPRVQAGWTTKLQEGGTQGPSMAPCKQHWVLLLPNLVLCPPRVDSVSFFKPNECFCLPAVACWPHLTLSLVAEGWIWSPQGTKALAALE